MWTINPLEKITMSKAGIIGLGSQGGPMARRMIDAGLDVVLWARRPQSLAPFSDTAAAFADSISALGAQVAYCGICVVDDAGVQQVCDELIPAMAPGSHIAIHSTVHPALCRALAVQARAHGLWLVDAPVSGGGRGAARGDLTVMVGGDEKAVATLQPIFQTFAGLVIHLGDVGAGQTAKLVNNNLMAANLALAHHALELADRLGIAREAFTRLVNVSSGRSFSFDVRARMASPGDFAHGAILLEKDLRLLGEVLGDSPHYRSMRNVAADFLDLALNP
ncbi:MAG: NAD(P)-dependent oxidoreductase [Pseudomonadota bacterium]